IRRRLALGRVELERKFRERMARRYEDLVAETSRRRGVGERGPAEHDLVHPAGEELMVLRSASCPIERAQKRMLVMTVAEGRGEGAATELAGPWHRDRSLSTIERQREQCIDRRVAGAQRELVLGVIGDQLEAGTRACVRGIAARLQRLRQRDELLPSAALH